MHCRSARMPTQPSDQTAQTLAVRPIEVAREKSVKVQQDLELAGAELQLTNTALERHLPHDARAGDVGRAIAQNVAVEEKVQEAAHDLATVTELLKEEVAQRKALERKLATATGAPPPQ